MQSGTQHWPSTHSSGARPPWGLKQLPQLPPQPLEAVCQCLEHEIISDPLAQTLAACLHEELSKEAIDPNLVSLLLRGLSGAANAELCAEQVNRVLHSPVADNAEVIASISGRCWLCLREPALLKRFLEALAACPQGQEFFNGVIVDLINIPGMQAPLHAAIRDTERSESLSRAIGELFQQFTGQ